MCALYPRRHRLAHELTGFKLVLHIGNGSYHSLFTPRTRGPLECLALENEEASRPRDSFDHAGHGELMLYSVGKEALSPSGPGAMAFLTEEGARAWYVYKRRREELQVHRDHRVLQVSMKRGIPVFFGQSEYAAGKHSTVAAPCMMIVRDLGDAWTQI